MINPTFYLVLVLLVMATPNLRAEAEVEEGTHIIKSIGALGAGKVIKGQRSGIWIYRVNEGEGNIVLICEYVNGVRHGIWNEYYPSSGRPMTIGEYRQDKQTGEWINFFENGGIASRGVMFENSRVGKWKDGENP